MYLSGDPVDDVDTAICVYNTAELIHVQGKGSICKDREMKSSKGNKDVAVSLSLSSLEGSV